MLWSRRSGFRREQIRKERPDTVIRRWEKLREGGVIVSLQIAAFFFVAGYTLSFFAVFLLRRREPTAPRPYRAFGHPWTTGFVLLGSLGFLTSAVVADRKNSLYALAIVLVSYPVFRLSRPRPIPTALPDPYLSGE